MTGARSRVRRLRWADELTTVTPTPVIEPECPNGHALECITFVAAPKTPILGCDMCQVGRILPGEQVHTCRECDYDVCVKCSQSPPSRPPSPYPWLRRKEGRRGFVRECRG